jgi:hypothetical protein
MTYTNDSNIWQAGPLNKLNLTAYSSPGTVGMQARWKCNFYGDLDLSKMPTASGEKNEVPFENRKAMHIWFFIDDSTFQQYAWFNGADDNWGELERWKGMNTHAGVGCYSWGAMASPLSNSPRRPLKPSLPTRETCRSQPNRTSTLAPLPPKQA